MDETTMSGNPAEANDYKFCPLMDLARVVALGASNGRASVLLEAVQCNGPRCAWYDQTQERCAVLSLARNK